VDFLLGLYTFFDANRAFYPLLIILSLLSLYMIYEKYRRTRNEITKRVETLDALIARVVKILDEEHGNPKVHLDLLRDISKELDSLEDSVLGHLPMCSQHFRDIDKLLDKSIYEQCNMDQCIGMTKIVTALDKLRDSFEDFNRVAGESRNSTGVTLSKLSDQVDTVRAEVNATTKSTLAILSESLRDRK
jgi:hypothetical protein